ncbi:hypothetical protein J4446_01000 [Candidatus Woesearchaeota archaeon]|nr:hypothetical protein [Candidatus Woesearchaeota archaeon]
MKTFEEFARKKKDDRFKRSGELGFNSYDHYLGFLYENGKYTFLEGPRTRINGADFATTANSLCDILEEAPRVRFELNFSEQIPEQEREFLKRLTKIVLEKEGYRLDAFSMAKDIASSRSSITQLEKTPKADPTDKRYRCPYKV